MTQNLVKAGSKDMDFCKDDMLFSQSYNQPKASNNDWVYSLQKNEFQENFI